MNIDLEPLEPLSDEELVELASMMESLDTLESGAVAMLLQRAFRDRQKDESALSIEDAA